MSTLALFRIYQAERDGGAARRVDLKQVFKNRIFSNQSINQLVTSSYFYFLVLITLYFAQYWIMFWYSMQGSVKPVTFALGYYCSGPHELRRDA